MKKIFAWSIRIVVIIATIYILKLLIALIVSLFTKYGIFSELMSSVGMLFLGLLSFSGGIALAIIMLLLLAVLILWAFTGVNMFGTPEWLKHDEEQKSEEVKGLEALLALMGMCISQSQKLWLNS
ncbi:MAG TPA: hypothetical protein ENN28_00495 [Candidatus Uhrbacteria bacterium]|nr:hypothetical protein [Candidatus Uhrbacteria bacterium]